MVVGGVAIHAYVLMTNHVHLLVISSAIKKSQKTPELKLKIARKRMQEVQNG